MMAINSTLLISLKVYTFSSLTRLALFAPSAESVPSVESVFVEVSNAFFSRIFP